MFELKHISYDSCPDCGARWAKIGFEQSYDSGQILRHFNGGEWETIEFTCGRKDAYIPNFLRIETKKPCCHTEAVRAEKTRLSNARVSLEKTINEINLTKEERDRLFLTVNCVLPKNIR